MVQVLRHVPQERPQSTRQRFLEAMAGGVGQGIQEWKEKRQLVNQEQKAMEQRKLEDAAVERLTGKNISGLQDPKMRQEMLARALQGQNDQEQQNAKRAEAIQQGFEDDKSFEKIEETFGNKFAQLWKAAPVGGRTELLKQGIDAKMRGADLEQMLQGVRIPQNFEEQVDSAKVPQMKDGKLPKDTQWPDYTKRPSGYSPKDWVQERKTWRSENSPVFVENKTGLKNSKRDSTAIQKLEKLNKSGKLPEGLESLIIDPSTGDIRGIAQLAGLVSPETQEWVKEIARFQNRAKDAFGSRVTNFDLMSYMKQFPGLLNSSEGRSRIIDMMQINNKMDTLYQQSLDQVYNKYGLNGIPQEQADSLAREMIEDETDILTDRYLKLDDENQRGEQLSGRTVDVIGPDGQEYEVDEREVDQLPEGYRIK